MTDVSLLFVSILVISPGPAAANPPPAATIVASAASKSPLKQAEELVAQKDLHGATNLLWKNISQLDRVGLIYLSKLHRDKGEWGEVTRATNIILSKTPRDEEAMTLLGEAQYRKAGKSSEAKETLQKVIEINRKYQPAYEILAQIYEKNPYERRLLYQDMVEVFGPRPAFITQLCALNANDGENEQGTKYCQQGVEISPQTPDNHVYLGIISKQKEEFEAAKKLLKKAAIKFPSSEFAQFEYANILESDKSWLESNQFYERCVSADGKSERCWTGVGNSSLQLRKYNRSLEAFGKSCQISGRKIAPTVRRAASIASQRKDLDWSEKLSRLAEKCSYF